MRILIVGDIHGNERLFERAREAAIKHGCEALIQVGDFGYFPNLWNFPNNKWSDIKVYFIDGNHDDHISLRDFKNSNFLEYVKRGTIKEFDGLNFMFIGGASSIDKMVRLEGVDWFKEENISEEDIDKCLDFDGPVDVIIAHECPAGYEPKHPIFSHDIAGQANRDKLLKLRRKYPNALWFHGHWHVSRIRNDGVICLNMLGVDSISCVVFDTSLKQVVDFERI